MQQEHLANGTNDTAKDIGNDEALAGKASAWLADLFAPWVRALDLRVERIVAGEVQMRLPFAPSLCREGGTICGQAMMAAADTAMVLAVSSVAGEFRPTTTVSLNTSFLRPVADGDVQIVARVIKPGRNLMFGQIDLYGPDGKLVAQATTTYAML